MGKVGSRRGAGLGCGLAMLIALTMSGTGACHRSEWTYRDFEELERRVGHVARLSPRSARHIVLQDDDDSTEIWARFELDRSRSPADWGTGVRRYPRGEVRVPDHALRGIGRKWWEPETIARALSEDDERYIFLGLPDRRNQWVLLDLERGIGFYWRENS